MLERSFYDFHSLTITVDPLELKLFVKKTAMSQNLSLSKHPVIYNQKIA